MSYAVYSRKNAQTRCNSFLGMCRDDLVSRADSDSTRIERHPDHTSAKAYVYYNSQQFVSRLTNRVFH